MSDVIRNPGKCVREALALTLAVVSGYRRGKSRELSIESRMRRETVRVFRRGTTVVGAIEGAGVHNVIHYGGDCVLSSSEYLAARFSCVIRVSSS